MMNKMILVFPLLLILFSSAIVPYSYASVESESQEDIVAGCRDGQSMVFRMAYRDLICVEPSTADRWIELGLAELISESSDPKTELSEIEIITDEQFPGAPPPAPKKASHIVDDFGCREGQILVYRLNHNDEFCTSTSTAFNWQRLGLAEIVQVEENQEIEDNLDLPLNTVNESNSENELIAESPDLLSRDLIKINDRIWIAVGYGTTNSVLIEGDDGIIVIDPLYSYESTNKMMEDFQSFSDKPVIIIIYTQQNPKLLEGSKALLEYGDGDVEIISSNTVLDSLSVKNYDAVKPNLTYSFQYYIDVSDVEINLFSGVGLNSDQTYVVLPEDDTMMAGDGMSGVVPFVIHGDYRIFSEN